MKGRPLRALFSTVASAPARAAVLVATLMVLPPVWAAAPASAPAAEAVACPPPPPAADPRARPRDRGFLWRLQRDGRSSWLYGTLHLGRADWVRLGPRMASALQASDTLALELDPSDPGTARGLAEAAPAAAPLPADVQAQLADATRRACLPERALAALHPVLQATTLTLLDARWLGLDAAHGLELVLAMQARQRGMPIVALEQLQQQVAALVPGAADGADAVPELLRLGLQQLQDGSARRVLARLAQAWEEGDLATLADHASWCQCLPPGPGGEAERARMARLNDERNAGLADGIAAQHGAGRRVFAAVGALHMTGPQALPRLLAERGFKVERIDFGSPAAPR
jgi:uncharacterized protein YbaP (TraB family)